MTNQTVFSSEDKKLLEANGVHINWSKLTKETYSLRDLARICDLSEPWVRTLLNTGKIPSTRDERNRYVVKSATVAQVRQQNAEKQLRRIKGVKSGSKSGYKPPRDFAFDMVSQAVTEDKTLTAKEKEVFLKRLKVYHKAWIERDKARKAKIEANRVEKEKAAKK